MNEESLFTGVLVCAHQWVKTRWNYLDVLAGYVLGQKQIRESSPQAQLALYRHRESFGIMPTLMLSKFHLENDVFENTEQLEVISKRMREDGMLVRSEKGRNTVGKNPYYHLKMDWLSEHFVCATGQTIMWSAESEAFERIGED